MNLDKRTLKLVKKIYRCPYITIAEIKLLFPTYYDLADLLEWLVSEKYISLRVAGSPSDDQGYEAFVYNDDAHLLCLRKGNISAEDTTLLRANLALAIAALSLAISFLSAFMR